MGYLEAEAYFKDKKQGGSSGGSSYFDAEYHFSGGERREVLTGGLKRLEEERKRKSDEKKQIEIDRQKQKEKEAYDKSFKGKLEKVRNIKWEDVKKFGRDAAESIRGGAELAGGMARDFGERVPLPTTIVPYTKAKIDKYTEAKKYAEERTAKNPKLDFDEQYQMGKEEYDARQLHVEKAKGEIEKRRGGDIEPTDYRFDIAEEGNVVERAKENWQNKEIRGAILALPEALTYFSGVGTSAKAAKAMVSSSIGKRILARSGSTVAKEALAETMLQQMKKDAEDRGIVSAGKDFVVNTLFMSAAGNVLGETGRAFSKISDKVKYKKGDSKVTDDVIDELETISNKELTPKEKAMVSDAIVNKGTKPSEIMENATYNVEEVPIKKIIGEKVAETKKIEKEKAVVAKEKEIQKAETEKKVSKTAERIEKSLKDRGVISEDLDKATFTPTTGKKEAVKVSKILADKDKTRRILDGEEKLPDNVSSVMFTEGVRQQIEKMTDMKKALETANKLVSGEFAGKTSKHAQELSLAQNLDPDSVVNVTKKITDSRKKGMETDISNEKKELEKHVKRAQSAQTWDDFVNEIKC